MGNNALWNWVHQRMFICIVAVPALLISMLLWFWGVYAFQEGITLLLGHPIIGQSDEWHPLAEPFLLAGPILTTWYCLYQANKLFKMRSYKKK